MNINRKIIVGLLSIGLLSVNCSEEKLNELPYDSFALANAFVTAADYENGVRGTILNMVNADYYGSSDAGSMLSFPDVMADNVIMTQRGRFTKRTLHEWVYNQDLITTGFYIDAYRTIGMANNVILAVERNNFQGPTRGNILAECRAIRAMAHFDLARTYAQIPTQSPGANASLGIVYNFTGIENPLTTFPRETVQRTYELILEDLLFAYDNINTGNAPARLNKQSVALLLSRVYLYMGQWDKVIQYADEVTTPIATRANVTGVWTDATNASTPATSGVIFRIPNLPGAGQLNRQIGVTWGQGSVNNNTPEYAVRFEFFQLFQDEDIRKTAFTQPVISQGLNFTGIKKLFGKTGQFNGVVDFKILRSEEALLNKAEAQYYSNPTAALATLNLLRNQRYTSYPGGETGAAILAAIKLERRLEFAFEYMRFFDIKRWGESIVRQNTGDLIDGTGQQNPSDALVMPAGSFKFQWPFNTQMLQNNPNLVQNPGY